MAQRGATSTTRNHGVFTAMRADLRGLRKEVDRVVLRPFEGLDLLDGAVKVKAMYIIDLVVKTPPSSPNSSDQPLKSPPSPKRRACACASTSGTAKKGPVMKKTRFEERQSESSCEGGGWVTTTKFFAKHYVKE